MNPFTTQSQAAIKQWIDEQVSQHPTTGPVGYGIDTNGHSIEVDEYHRGAEAVEIGTFEEGWLTQPAEAAECAGCDGEQPALVHAHSHHETIILDCLNCRDRTAVVLRGEERV